MESKKEKNRYKDYEEEKGLKVRLKKKNVFKSVEILAIIISNPCTYEFKKIEHGCYHIHGRNSNDHRLETWTRRYTEKTL